MKPPTTQRELDTDYGRYPWVLFAFAVVWAVVLVALPDDAYVRFQQLGGDFVKAQWVYERIVFDDAPIDVAVLGTSRTMDAVDSGMLSEAVSAAGTPIVAANLAVPQHGRNLHRAFLERALEHKAPALVLIEVREIEDRRGHAMFAEVADVDEMLGQPLVLHFNVLSDAAKFARRRPTVALASLMPSVAEVDPAFDAGAYWGTHPAYHREGDVYAELSKDFLDHLASDYDRDVADRVLPGSLAGLEHRFAVDTLERIAAAAEAEGAGVAFYYLPGYGSGGREPVHADVYRELGELWLPPAELFEDPTMFIDLHHVRKPVREAYTAWLAGRVAEWMERRPDGGSDRAGGADGMDDAGRAGRAGRSDEEGDAG
ncbi:MAG: hypothetical protein AAF078_01180 [Planctomycetota bacterium]